MYLKVLVPILLSSIGSLSYFYSFYIMKYISSNISIEVQSMILMFIFILVQLDNFSLYNDLQKNMSFTVNQDNIRLIGNQAIELQKTKMIIYQLTKINETPLYPSKKIMKKGFSSSF